MRCGIFKAMGRLYLRALATGGALLATLLLCAGGCARTPRGAAAARDGASALGGKPVYLVTVTPLKLILEPVVGTRAEVDTLLPPGASTHTYEPKPSDAVRAGECTALFWVGANYDGWAAVLDAPSKLELLPLLPPELLLSPAEHERGEAAGEADPHFFTDPLTVKALLPVLVKQLTLLDPAGAREYSANANAFARELDKLDRETATLLAPIKGQATLLFHPSFAYIFRRYGIRLAGVIEQFPGKEPSPRYLDELTQLIRSERIRAIFTETLLPRQPAEVIAEATHTPVFELDPSCGASAQAYPDYRTWLLYNARILRDALGR